ncbi:unnamed protein product [Paramecium octaurelia]|uniref:Uncharacterized protein n=1 Tax=Paramecium octaurelia TaxID=43137 RepID=A0A8S1W5T0_PAROT|nr:unnamed protein product [Paramecium octaurelia]
MIQKMQKYIQMILKDIGNLITLLDSINVSLLSKNSKPNISFKLNLIEFQLPLLNQAKPLHRILRKQNGQITRKLLEQNCYLYYLMKNIRTLLFLPRHPHFNYLSINQH